MRHILCIARHAKADIEQVNGKLVDRELTAEGERQAHRIANTVRRRYGTNDLCIDSSGEKRAMDTARCVSHDLGDKPVFEAAYMNSSITPFDAELKQRLESTDHWWGVFLLIAHFAFIDEAYMLVGNEYDFKRLGSIPREFPYGSMVIIDVDAHTVEYVSNDRSP